MIRYHARHTTCDATQYRDAGPLTPRIVSYLRGCGSVDFTLTETWLRVCGFARRAMRASKSSQGLVLLLVVSVDAASPPSSPVACGRWPTIFVLGVQKAGTTTLSASLTKHTNITVGPAPTLASSTCCSHAMQANNVTDSSEQSPSNRMCRGFMNGWPKETHFWNWCLTGRRQLCAAYPALFPRNSGSFAVDMTPEYISDLRIPSALAAFYPRGLQHSARFIVMLREPVARLFSAFKHYARAGWLPDSTMTFDAWTEVFCCCGSCVIIAAIGQ